MCFYRNWLYCNCHSSRELSKLITSELGASICSDVFRWSEVSVDPAYLKSVPDMLCRYITEESSSIVFGCIINDMKNWSLFALSVFEVTYIHDDIVVELGG